MIWTFWRRRQELTPLEAKRALLELADPAEMVSLNGEPRGYRRVLEGRQRRGSRAVRWFDRRRCG